MVLGIAVGGREDDFTASDADFDSRGKKFDSMLDQIKDVWAGSAGSSGAEADDGVGPDVAAQPPQLILGGSIDAAFRRAARYGDGWIMGGGTPEMLSEGREKLLSAWSEAGREGEPRVMALAYFSLGDTAEAAASTYLKDYYAWLGESADQIAASAAKDPETVRGYQQAFTEAGCDELFWIPASPDPAQVELLAEAAL